MQQSSPTKLTHQQVDYRVKQESLKKEHRARLMQRVHMAIWSPVTWLHKDQLQDDYLFFNTIRQVFNLQGKDFLKTVLTYLRRDEEQMDFMLGSKKRIYLFNEIATDGNFSFR